MIPTMATRPLAPLPRGSCLARGQAPNGSSTRAPDPVKSFGHRYLRNESLVLVGLGSMDMRKNLPAVNLDRVPLAEAHTTQLDTALSIVISATGAQGEPSIIDLPVHDNVSTEPVVFTTSDASKVKLLFDIVPTYSGNEKNKIGRGVALLSTVKPSIGTKRMNLQGDVCVPIIGSNLEVIGAVNFNFSSSRLSRIRTWRSPRGRRIGRNLDSTMVIGHRGLGKNATSNKSSSSVRTRSLLHRGRESRCSVRGVRRSAHQRPRPGDLPRLPGQRDGHRRACAYLDPGAFFTSTRTPPDRRKSKFISAIQNKTVPKMRSNSPGPRQRSHVDQLRGRSLEQHKNNERMKHTRDFKEKGFKANSRGTFIQAPFATLEDLFRQATGIDWVQHRNEVPDAARERGA